jgi:hypothetical protein
VQQGSCLTSDMLLEEQHGLSSVSIEMIIVIRRSTFRQKPLG